MAGYSGIPLAKKLGIKNAAIITLVNAPDYYLQLFTDMPADVYFVTDDAIKKILFIFLQSNALSF